MIELTKEQRKNALQTLAALSHEHDFFYVDKPSWFDVTTEQIEARNDYCGDLLQLFINGDGDAVNHYGFSGHACSVCKAAAVLLGKCLLEQGLSEFEKNNLSFKSIVEGVDTNAGHPFFAFRAIAHLPARQQCALLSWQALNKHQELKHVN